MELLSYIIVFIAGFFIGEAVFAHRFRKIIYKIAQDKGIQITESDAEPIIEVNKLFIEKSNNVMYLYDFDANTFVCQGNSLDELARLSNKYNNIKYALVEFDKQVVFFVDGVVKKEI